MSEHETDDPEHPPPVVDLHAALGSAGHELEDLGWVGVPDSAPVLHSDDDDEERRGDFDHHAQADIATRGQGH